MASPSILLVFLAFMVVALPIRGAVTGGWKPIANPNDPDVVAAAKFAVTEHNKDAHTSLVFGSVVSGESQVVAGTNYRLVISAKDGGAAGPKTYRAEVYSRPWQKFYQLVSFVEIKG